MNEQESESKPGAPAWMVTFADLMSLLMTFFVMLLSFSNMEIVKFRTMAGSVRNALGLKSEFDLSDTQSGQTLLPFEDPQEGEGGTQTREIVRELEKMLEEADLAEKGEVKVSKYGAVLQLEGDFLFDSGDAELKRNVFPLLDELADYITSVGRSVDVVGHTDNVPISNVVYPSNWELSAARAGQAVQFLVEEGVPPKLMRAIGRADTVPVADNSSPEGRAKNRRVEFVFAAHTGPTEEMKLDEVLESTDTTGAGEAP